MQIIPVLDILAGQVVRGIAGRRSEYRPIVSQLTNSTQPVDVAESFRRHFALTTLYLADLDAIAGAAPAVELYSELRDRGFCVWVDAGVRDEEQASEIAASGIDGIVLGLETIQGPAVLTTCRLQLGTNRLIFSLDLKAGKPLGELSAWKSSDPFGIALEAIGHGIRRMIVLDLQRVGGGEGTGTEALCQRLSALHEDVELIAGGGVRDQADIDRLAACGLAGVLVASALHDGRLIPKA